MSTCRRLRHLFAVLFPFCAILILVLLLHLPTAGAAPAEQRIATTWTFQGRVYDGVVGDQSRPMHGVTVSIYGANNGYPDPGAFIRSGVTDRTGWYGVPIYDDDGNWEYYHIRSDTGLVGYVPAGATTVSGTVRTASWIEYSIDIPLSEQVLTGNKFWYRSLTVTATPSATIPPTPSPTATSGGPLSTSTPTVTATRTGEPDTPTPTATLEGGRQWVVNTVADHDDGACESLEAGDCTLREAILWSNEMAGADQILFDIPPDQAEDGDYLIAIVDPLPPLLDGGTMVDGFSQPGAGSFETPGAICEGTWLINLIGAGAVPGTSGMQMVGASAEIKGLIIREFPAHGVWIHGSGATGNTVYCNWMWHNSGSGVALTDGAHDNTVGSVNAGNLLSANGGSGVYVQGEGTDSNEIVSNHIGVDYAGSAALANTYYGVHITAGAQQNDVGGELVGEGNVIAGNMRTGVMIDGAETMGNRLGGNLIGLSADGQNAIPNGHHGVGIYGGASGNQVGSSFLQPNTISASGWTGVAIVDSSTNGVFGNRIGTALNGTTDRGNGYYGVAVVSGSYNVISSNRIAYNGHDGVRIDGPTALHNTITVNSITANGARGIENINGGNAELAPPVITSATTSTVSGTACAGCQIEVFSDASDEGANVHSPPAAIADAGGNWTWTGSASGAFVTATATDGDNNTSEFSAPFSGAGTLSFSGRVFMARAPWEPPYPPAQGVVLVLAGSQSPDELGVVLREAVSAEDGAYQVMITDTMPAALIDYEYLHLAVVSEELRVVEATSASGGITTEDGWIQFHRPDTGPHPDNDIIVEPADLVERHFTGQVFEGEPDDRSHPAPHVPVGLLKAAITCEEGLLVAEAVTNEEGRFDLEHLAPAGDDGDAPYYNVMVLDPDFQVAGAQSESGGQPTNQGWLQFENPPAGLLDYNDFFGHPVLGETISPAAMMDAHVNRASSSSNFGDYEVLRTDFSAGIDSYLDRAWVYFDLDHIPSDVTITKATLEMYLEQAGGKDKVCMSVHRALDDWCEKSPCSGGLSPITWGNMPAHFLSPAATHYVDTNLGYKSWDVTNLVQSWVDGSAENQGLLLMGEEEGNDWSRYFSSREGAHPPHLVIHVVSGSPIITPTPTATVTATPSPTVTATPADRGLVITGIEVNQAVQDQRTQDVALVAGKKAVVRVHLKVTDGKGNLPGIDGTLRYPYPSGAIYYPINTGGTITARPNPDRGQLEHTLNFLLPASAASGTGLSFMLAQVLPPAGVTFNGGQYELVDTLQVEFETVPSMRLRLVGVTFVTNTVSYSPRNIDYARTESWLRAAYPIPNLISSRTTTNWTSTTALPNCGGVNTILAQMKVQDVNNKVATNDTRYHGLVFDGGPLWFQMVGCCCNSGASSGPAGQGFGGSNRFAWDRDGSYADWYAGHEIGHGYGQCHPGYCRGQTVDTSSHCGTYPYPNGYIGGTAGDPQRYYGLDVETLTVMGPTWTDVMTYCDYEWISDFTYERIMNQMISPLSFSMVRTAAGERLLVMGTVDLETDAVALDPFVLIPDATYTVERTPGEYSIELLGGGDVLLAGYPFTPKVQDVEQNTNGASCAAGAAEETPQVPASIFEFVTWDADTQRVRITHDGEELASRDVSAHAPAVTVTSPNGGEVLDGDTIDVAWSAEDADGDDLSATLLYSADGGESWMTLVSRVTGDSYPVDAGLLAGSEEALIRVTVSDGVNTTSDESDEVFTITDRRPQVSISWPPEGSVYSPDEVVSLVGDAYDPEDGALDGESLVWESDLQGVLGTGQQLVANMLTTGRHEITMSATDSEGHTEMAVVHIEVAERARLPLLMK